MSKKSVAIVLWAFLALIVVGGLAYHFAAPSAPKVVSTAAPATSGVSFGGGHYQLIDQDGHKLDQSMVIGHPSMLFFGFTHCTDVCPTTLAEMASWFQSLGARGKDLRAYFVTVDPARDTPKVLKAYIGAVSDRVTGVTGTQAEIDKIVAAYHIYVKKVPVAGTSDYSVDHTATVFLINAKGEYADTIDYEEPDKTALAKLAKLVAG